MKNYSCIFAHYKRFQPLGMVILLLILSTSIVFYRLDVPQAIIFDETYHIPSAQKYLNGVFFQEYHPPLGKLLIAAGYLLVDGDKITDDFVNIGKINQDWPKNLDITGFRISSAFFGIFLPVIFFFLILVITNQRILSFLISLLILLDPAIIMQSRIAMLDVFLLFFIGFSLFFVAYLEDREIKIQHLVLWGFVSGCAVSIKYTGLISILPILVLALDRKRSLKPRVYFLMIFFLTLFITFIIFWQIHFSLTNDVVDNNTYNASHSHLLVISDETESISPLEKFYIRLADSFQYHITHTRGVPALKLGDPDEIGSAWYHWMLGGRAINYRWETGDGISYKYSYLITNPITWMISLLGVILSTSIVLSHALFDFLPNNNLKRYLFVFVCLYWAYLIPFWFIKRVMYLYHYLPGMVIGLVLFAIVMRLHLISHKKYFILSLSLIVFMALIIFILLSPFIYYQDLTSVEFQIRNFWPFWDLQCISCK